MEHYVSMLYFPSIRLSVFPSVHHILQVPHCVQRPAKPYPFSNKYHVLQCPHDVDVHLLFISRRAEGPGWEILKCPPSIHLSVRHVYFRTVTRTRIDVFSVGSQNKIMFYSRFWKNNSFSFHVLFAFYSISNIFRKNYFFQGGGGVFLSKIKKISFCVFFAFYAIATVL